MTSGHIPGHQPASQGYRQMMGMLDSIDQPIYIATADSYELLYVNRALRQRIGEFAGQKCHQALHGLAEPCSFCTNRHILGDNLGRTHVREFHDPRDNRWYRCTDSALRWFDGRQVRLELAIDITAQKQAGEAHQQSQKLYRLLAENIMDVIFTMDLQLRFTYCSPSVQRLLGYTGERMLAMSLSQIMSSTWAGRILGMLEEDLAQEASRPDPERSRMVELELRRKAGGCVWSEVKVSYYRGQYSFYIVHSAA